MSKPDDRYVKALEKWDKKSELPRCPVDKGVMRAWDAWLVTGATCEKCGWTYSEGSGCLSND